MKYFINIKYFLDSNFPYICAVQCRAVQCRAVQCSVVQCSAVQTNWWPIYRVQCPLPPPTSHYYTAQHCTGKPGNVDCNLYIVYHTMSQWTAPFYTVHCTIVHSVFHYCSSGLHHCSQLAAPLQQCSSISCRSPPPVSTLLQSRGCLGHQSASDLPSPQYQPNNTFCTAGKVLL